MQVTVNNQPIQIFFNHFEVEQKKGSQRGTECVIRPLPESPAIDPVLFGVGVATCSNRDNFNYIEGRKLALARALKDAGWGKETRTQVWLQYRQKCRVSNRQKLAGG